MRFNYDLINGKCASCHFKIGDVPAFTMEDIVVLLARAYMYKALAAGSSCTIAQAIDFVRSHYDFSFESVLKFISTL